MGIGDFVNSLGDKIEDGLETATEKVGQAYNTVLDAESKVAKAVGADGLSNRLDDLGDKVVDATGGALPEKELGETTDPKELIRGEPAKITEVAGHLGKIGTAIDQTGDALRKIDVSDWSGDASSAFHEEFAEQPKLWWDGADAMGKAKTALDAWYHEVTAAQAKAADAIAKWEAADREERDRKNAWNAQTDEQRKGKNLTDTWTDIRNEARAILNSARTQRDNAANAAVSAITAATETAPTEPPFLSRWGSNFEDLGAAIEHAKINFSSGLLTSLTGMVQFVRSISPVDIYNITHPAEYMSKMSDLGTGMVLAAADPKATGAAMLSGFKTNPSEALGALTGDALTTIATGGAGGVAKAGATTVNRVSEVASTGRNALDNAAGAAGRHAPESPSVPTSPTQPASVPDSPSSPTTNPAGNVGDSPAPNPTAATPDASANNPTGQPGDTPATSPAGTAGDNASPTPASAPETPRNPEPDSAAPNNSHESPESTPSPNGADESPSGKPTPDGPDSSPESPATPSPDGNDSSPNPDDDSPNHHDDGDNGPGATDPANPASMPDDRTGDPDKGTEPGGHDGQDNDPPVRPDANDSPEQRSSQDNGGNGNDSAGETGQKNPPETDSTDGQTAKCQDPVNVATGEFLLPLTDVDLPGILHLLLKRAHHSNYRFGRWFGPSWSATLDMRVVVETDCVTVVLEDGMLLPYPHAEVGVGVEPLAGGQRWKLTRTDVGGYRLWDPDRELVWHFAPEPVLDGLDTLLGNFAISAITDRHQNRIRFHYNDNGDPTEVTHSGGYRVVLDSAHGRVTAISVAGEVDDFQTLTRVREFGYEHGELVTVTNGVGGTTRFAYDDQHRMLSWTDSNGSWVANTYDDAGRVVSQRGTGGVYDATIEYLEFGDGTGRLTRVTNSRGAVTGYGFDNDLRLRDFRAADGGHRRITYNADRKPLTVQEPDGATTRYRYTADGDVAAITRPDGSEVAIDYAHANRPTTVTRADGTTQHREWDKSGNLVAAIDAIGARTEYTHGPCGAVTAVRDPDGSTSYIEVDGAGLPVAVTDPYGATSSIRRDAFGRHVQITDALGQVTQFEWTAEGRPLRRIDPDGFAECWTYDGENNVLTHTDRNGGVTSYTYGGFDQVASRTDPDGSVTRYLYNTELQLIAVVNPLGHRWTYEYDTAGRLASETDYTGALTTYTHTTTGRVATVTPATGVTRHHRYDILGNLASITADTGEYIAYTHDPAGRVLTAINGVDETLTHTLGFTYTPAGEIASQRLDDQPPLTNEYDHRGRRIRRISPTGATTTWRHNTINQVTAMHADGQDISFIHDRAGRLTQWRVGEVQIERTFTGSGTVAAQRVTAFPTVEFSLDFGDAPSSRPTPFEVRSDAYVHRPDGFLTEHTTSTPSAAPAHAQYSLDVLGRVNTITRNSAVVEAYEYDPLSNITASLASNSDAREVNSSGTQREYHNNLLVRDGRNHYYYDPAGRLIRKVTTRISRKPDVWHFRYNAFDQLTDLYTPDGEWWRYTYDGQGRRCRKTQFHKNDGVWQPGVHTDYVYDTHRPIEQTVTGQTERWHYLPNSYTPVLIGRDDHQGGAVIADPAGAPLAIVDPATATVRATFNVSLWGDLSQDSDATTSIRLPGQIFDSESGLHYNLQRYYDPGTGRFLTVDPLGLAPSPNPHAYPENPTRWIDPLGLAPDVTDCPMAGEPPAPGIVFRALSPGEDPALGLFARDVDAEGVSPLSHVAGKQNSPWISTSYLPETAFSKYNGGNGIVAIDLSRVDSFTDVSSGFPGKGRLDFYARKDLEVLIYQHVPPEAIIGFWQ